MNVRKIARVAAFAVALAVLTAAVVFAINDGIEQRRREQAHDITTPGGAAAFADFVVYYEHQHGDLEEDDAAKLWSNGLVLCNRLEDTRSLSQTFDHGLAQGMSSDQTATVIEASIHSICPELSYLIKPTVKPDWPSPPQEEEA